MSLQDLAPCPEPNEQFEPRDEVPPATEIADKPEEIPADTPTPSTSPEQLPGLRLRMTYWLFIESLNSYFMSTQKTHRRNMKC